MTAQILVIQIIAKLLSPCIVYAEDADIHYVQRGEVFSRIARRYLGGPTYGPIDGAIARLAQLNPQIKNPDFILPGDKIHLAPPDGRKTASSSTEDPSFQLVDNQPVDTAQPQPIETAQPESPAPPCKEIPSPKVMATVPAPKGDPSPSTQQPETPSADEEVGHRLLVSAAYGMTTLSASDASSGAAAKLNSSHDLGAEIAWEQEWSTNFSTSIGATLRKIDFEPSTNPAKTLANTSHTTTGLSIGGESTLSSKLSLSYGVRYDNELFLHGTNSSTVTVDAAPILSGNAGASLEIYQKGKTSLGIKGRFDYLLPSSTETYSINSGTAYQGKLYLHRHYGTDNAVELDIGYKDRAQSTSAVNFSERSVFSTLTFSLPLFEGGEKK